MDFISLGNEDCPLPVIMANLIFRSCEPFSFLFMLLISFRCFTVVELEVGCVLV